MKILVTGGAGFIASHVVDAYINEGHEVVVLDDLSSGQRENLNPKAKFYEADICSKEAENIIKNEKPEILNHHAAQIDVRASVAEPKRDVEINVLGLINLIEAGRSAGLKKVIFASSGGAIYGEQDVFPADENHPVRPISPYGINKYTCEKYLYYYQQQYGISYVALRYANVYGPRQNTEGEAGVVAIFTSKMLADKQPLINGDGRQTRDYVYVGDVVDVNKLALKPELEGSYNVGTGIETDVNVLFQNINKILAANFSEKYAPAKLGEQMRSVIVAKKFRDQTGWAPKVELLEGLKKTVEYFKRVKSELEV